jgi:hypothetical protein
LLRPTPVAIHDDRDVRWNFSQYAFVKCFWHGG